MAPWPPAGYAYALVAISREGQVPMVLTHHEVKTLWLSSVLKHTHNSHSFRIDMFRNNVDLKTTNRNYRKLFWTLCVRE